MVKDLVKQFEEIRIDFLRTLWKFPKERVEEILFGEWNLKDVIAHFSGWDIYFTETLRRLKQGKPIPYWGTIDEFNAKSVSLRKSHSWEEIYNEFVKAGEDFLDEYRNTPEELQNRPFWAGKKYTPLKFLKINIQHYLESQLVDIKKLLTKWKIK